MRLEAGKKAGKGLRYDPMRMYACSSRSQASGTPLSIGPSESDLGHGNHARCVATRDPVVVAWHGSEAGEYFNLVKVDNDPIERRSVKSSDRVASFILRPQFRLEYAGTFSANT